MGGGFECFAISRLQKVKNGKAARFAPDLEGNTVLQMLIRVKRQHARPRGFDVFMDAVAAKQQLLWKRERMRRLVNSMVES